MSYEIRFTKTARKQIALCKSANLGGKVRELLDIIRENPFQVPPSCEKLKGLDNVYSRRINIQHRLVYHVDVNFKRIKILSLWTHYEYE